VQHGEETRVKNKKYTGVRQCKARRHGEETKIKKKNTQECDNNAELDDMARIEQDAHGEHFSKVFF
jgi:hypothetical protein